MASAIVVGAAGRMGRLVTEELARRGFDVLGGYDEGDVAELDAAAPAADLVVDFSAPGALPHVVAYARRTGAAVVSGVTGLMRGQLADLRSLGEKNRVVWSANYSLGVAALRRATAMVAEALAGWDVEIVETHHNRKVDAPSGTAKALLAAVDPGGERSVVDGRSGIVWGSARPARSACTRCAAARSPARTRCTSSAPTRRSASRTAPRAARSS